MSQTVRHLYEFGPFCLDATERLPVTVSAGLVTYPEHGSSVTVLLATAASTLEEAKASGGDTVRIGDTEWRYQE